MQNKKVTMLAAVLAVTIIAMAGVGYAASYTAKTTNTDNYMDSTYVTLTQSSGATPTAAYSGNFLTDLLFDTINETNDQTIKYVPVYTGNLSDDNVYDSTAESKNVALISKDLTLNVTPSKQVDGKKATLTVSVGEGQFSPAPNLKYTMLITSADSAGYKQSAVYNNGWSFDNLPMEAAHSFKVMLFVSLNGEATSVGSSNSGFVATAQDSQNKAVFTFLLEAEA